MRWLRRLEMICGVGTVLAGAAALVYAGATASNSVNGCTTQGSFTYCEVTSSSELTSASAPGWPGVILAVLLFTPILIGLLGFCIGDSVSRARGSLLMLWLFALLLSGAMVVALLPLFIVVRPLVLPTGWLFLPAVALGFATALLGTIAPRSHSSGHGTY